MRQTALVRLDGVGERDRLGALRALHLDVAPHFRKSGGPPAASARRDYAYSVLDTSATMSESTARLWHPWLRINRFLRLMLHERWTQLGDVVAERGSPTREVVARCPGLAR